jgi:hypothetical protein
MFGEVFCLWSSCCKNYAQRYVGFGMRVSVRASCLGKMYVRAICLCGLAVRLILAYRGDTKKGSMTLYDALRRWRLVVAMKRAFVYRIRAPEISLTFDCGTRR